eukprot:g24095.t1
MSNNDCVLDRSGECGTFAKRRATTSLTWNESGYLDQQEFAACYAALGGIHPSEVIETKFRILWEEVDEDHNGQIDLLEFAKWYLRLKPLGRGRSKPILQGIALNELDVRQQAERTERNADLDAVRADLDRQWEELSKALAASVAETETRVQKDKRELSDALAAVCSDIEALRKQQKDLDGRAVSLCHSYSFRISSELHELQLQQARVRGNIEQALREDLQSFVLEELQVRRLNELEVLQAEDSRHRADIDALRQKQNAALEALRQEETVRRDALEAKCFGELQAKAVVSSISSSDSHPVSCIYVSVFLPAPGSEKAADQLHGGDSVVRLFSPKDSVDLKSREAVSSMPPPSPVKAEDPDAVFERLLQELREECGVLGERLGEDVAQLRAQLAEGLGEVRTAQVQQAADLQVVRSAWDARWEELQAAKDAETKSEAAESPEAQIASFQQGLTVKNRLSMQNREIEELQRQLLDTLRDLGAVRRLSSEVEGLRQERQRDIAELMDLAKQRDGEAKSVRVEHFQGLWVPC